MFRKRKVLAGGVFNILHPGHLYFLRQAKKLGDTLVVVVAADRTVLKNRKTLLSSARERADMVSALSFVDKVVIGDENDMLRVVRDEHPDVIALGYDQDMHWVEKALDRSGLKCHITRIGHLKGYSTNEITGRRGRKAQLWSLDMAFSLLIFFSAMLAAVFAWNYISLDTAQSQQLREMQLKALSLSDSLIRTPGIPGDWNMTTVSVIGLASNDNVLDEGKVNEFVNMSHTLARTLLDIRPYDFYFEVRDINGTVYKNSTIPISAGSSVVVPANRYALYAGRIVNVMFVLWE